MGMPSLGTLPPHCNVECNKIGAKYPIHSATLRPELSTVAECKARTRDVEDLLRGGGVAEHEGKRVCEVLHLPELRHLLAAVGHADGPVLREPVEEELLHRVVVQGPVDVHGPHGREVGASLPQQILRV